MVIGVRRLGQKTLRFTLRQSRNWKTMLVRRSLQAVGMNLSEQYNLIYATALGANPVQLGSLQSAGNAMGALISPPAGWLIDNYSLKKVFLFGTLMMAASAALYFIAPHWAYLYAAIILYYMGMRVTCTCCTVTCANELANEERATGRGLCRTVSSVVALVAPMLGAWVVAMSGGINVTGLRPLYAVQVVIYALVFGFLVAVFLDPAVAKRPREGWHVFADFVDIFRQGHDVTKIMFMIALIELPWCMVSPFMPLFAHQFKGADEFVLGGIATATRVAPLLVAIPLGRLADRHGRKKLLFLLAPLSNAANLCLIFAPGRNMLLLSGLLFGLNSINTGIAAAMAAEIVPKGQMGRWIGMISLMRGLISIPAPLIAGLIWDQIGPEYVFIAATLIDLAVRLPLVASIRETLHLDIEDHQPLE